MTLAFTSLAQKTTLDGTVVDEKNQPLEMANVLVLNAGDSSMVSYGFSDADGFFRFKLTSGQPYILRVTYLGFVAADKSINPNGEKQTVKVQLQPDNETLDAVNVVEEMPIVITGDTISYKADAFTTGEERRLEDVIKQLPGFEIDDDGQVKVEGKTVEKVMVEGKDFFDGDSKIAVENIPADAVDKIQVVRNYEEISPLAGLSSEDRIALNIKLKEGKKNLWFGDIEAKGGDPERYMVHGNAFFYTPKASFNIIGDINNIGQPAFTIRDYFRFSGGMRNLSSRSGSNFNFAADDVGIPLGQNNRAEEITSRFGAANFNYSPSKPLTISGFFIANQSTTVSPYVTYRNYIGQADSLSSNEELTTENYSNNLTGLGKVSVDYNPKPEFQVNYDLFAKISDQKENQSLISDFGDFENEISTRTVQQPYEIKQNAGLYADKGKSVYTVEAQFMVKRQDPSFAMTQSEQPFIGSGLFNFADSSLYQLVQNEVVESQQLQVNTGYYYVINTKNHIEFSAGGSLNNQQYFSEINEGDLDDQNSLESEELLNDVDFSLKDAFVGLHYKTKLGKLTVRPGANYHLYQVDQEQATSVTEDDYWILLPDLLVQYDFKSSENLRLNYSMQAQFNDVNQVMTGVLIQSYNSLFTGNQSLQNATTHNVNLNYFKYDMYNFTNIYGGINYSRTLDGITNAVNYIGNERVLTPINSPGYNENLTGYGSWSRRFKWIKTDARANWSFNNTNNTISGVNNSNQTFNQSYTAGIGTNFDKWPNIDLGYTYTNNDYLGNNAASTYTNHMPNVELTAEFLKDFVLRADYSYNNYGNVGSATRTTFDFLNASLEYQKKDSPWLFSFEALNLLNTDIIQEDGLSDNLITTTVYTVLPRYLLFGVRYDL